MSSETCSLVTQTPIERAWKTWRGDRLNRRLADAWHHLGAGNPQQHGLYQPATTTPNTARSWIERPNRRQRRAQVSPAANIGGAMPTTRNSACKCCVSVSAARSCVLASHGPRSGSMTNEATMCYQYQEHVGHILARAGGRELGGLARPRSRSSSPWRTCIRPSNAGRLLRQAQPRHVT